MKRALGKDLSKLPVWIEDGAKPQQADMVMDWLESIFEDKMLAIKSRRGDTGAPSSLDLNPLDFFVGIFE